MIFTDAELLEPCKKIIESKLDMLHKDGGDLEFLGVKNGIVYVKLLGACKGCSSANITLKFGLEKSLREQIDDSIRVVNLDDGMEAYLKL